MAEDQADLRQTGVPNPRDLLEVARQAAAAGQPDQMLEALAGSGFLDGLIQRLETQWRGRLPRTEIDESVAIAVDGAYAAVSGGRAVHNLGAWIWKAASNQAINRWNRDYDLRISVKFEVLPDPGQSYVRDSEADDRLAEHRVAEAIRLARSLLPRIGQGQIVDVMTLVIDAVEQGVPDLPPDAIGATLGISASAVRSLLSRGFDRLEREARREGIVLPDAVPFISRDHDDDESPQEFFEE